MWSSIGTFFLGGNLRVWIFASYSKNNNDHNNSQFRDTKIFAAMTGSTQSKPGLLPFNCQVHDWTVLFSITINDDDDVKRELHNFYINFHLFP